MTQHNFMWLKFETTGLDPANGLVLEFAVVLCEDNREDDLAIVQQYTAAIHYDTAALARVAIHPDVQRAHTGNGLWRDVDASTITITDVDDLLCALAGDARRVTLAGAYPDFERSWIAAHMPEFAKRVSFRSFDVNHLRNAIDTWGHSRPTWPKAPRTLRAMPDLLQTLEIARVAKRALEW